METEKMSTGKFGMNYGIILGVVMIALSVIGYVTGQTLEGAQWPQYTYYIIFPVIIFYAISKYKSHNANILALGDAIKVGIIIAIISAIVYIIYSMIFNYIIDPDFMGQMKEVVRDTMLENPNFTEDQVDQQMVWVEKMMSPVIGSAFWIAASALFGLIWSLIGGLVMKSK
nr:DUF4199 domain-containing protein [uncultured Psychroserpens sp.]